MSALVLLQRHRLWLIGAGAVPAAFDFPHALTMSTLWLLWMASAMAGRASMRALIGYLTLSASIWGLLHWALPQLPGWLLMLGWAGLIGLVWQQRQKQQVIECAPWPRMTRVWPITAGLGLVALLAYIVLRWVLALPIELGAATSLTWAVLALLLAYPPLVGQQERRGVVILLSLVLLAGVGSYHLYAIREFRHEYARGSDSLPAAAAQEAFNKGYRWLGADYAALETRRLLSQAGWAEAVYYLRDQWRYLPRTALIERLAGDRNPDALENPFFMLACFGGHFALKPGESVIDFGGDESAQTLAMLTSQKRLILINEAGWRAAEVPIEAPKALALLPDRQGAAVLGDKQVMVLDPPNTHRLPLPEGDEYVDLVFADGGARLYLLTAHGAINQYAPAAGGGWQWAGNAMLPIWQEPIAAAIDAPPAQQGWLVMDEMAGVYYRTSPEQMVELSPFRNPYRPVMVDLEVDPLRSHVLLLDNQGRLDFATLQRRVPEQATLEPARRSVSAAVTFDRRAATTVSPHDPVGMVYLPSVQTVLQCNRNGLIQAVLLPMGLRLEYRKGGYVVRDRERASSNSE